MKMEKIPTEKVMCVTILGISKLLNYYVSPSKEGRHIVLVWFLYPPQTKFGGLYRNHPVRLSMYFVSATPPKPLIGFLWNFTHL
jgi:hypothetical protein